MILTQTSVSQVTSADHSQEGGCKRRFWFERVHDMRAEMDNARSDGGKGHELIKRYLRTGEAPAKRVKMGKHVTALILKGSFLPALGDDLIVETRFDGSSEMFKPVLDAEGKPVLDEEGQPKREWIPMNPAETYWLAGLPWDGAIDLTYRRGDIPTVVDWKFSSDIEAYAKRGEDLIKTVQMPIYVASQIPYWPDASRFEIAHGYVARSGIKSFIRRAIVTLDQVREREAQISTVVEEMKVVAGATSQDDVPFNRRACHSWMGCPQQHHCNAFRRNLLDLTPEEQALLNGDASAVPALDDGLEDLPPLDDAPEAPPPVDPAIAAKAAAKAKLLAELEALDAPPAPVAAAAKPAAKASRVPIVDVETPPAEAPGSAPVASAPAAAAPPPCPACGAVITAENGSKPESGLWQHVGCPKNAAAPAAKPAPKPRAPKAPPPAPAAATQPAAATPIPKVVSRTDGPGPTSITVTLEFSDAAELTAFFAGR